ncbi:hypothetical protein TNIN_9861 [Trichonephila inaurata madagascariensis]|uniref:Uncharacterized protein n=1 Tax=Trichonephila inaurata madagascariensis TaxID=2747483 RepID=A0A8X7BNU9_9ARAC|nr:hypothetical protein TNIN_9861 [Trichonephila inaurata madagascariensis]
MLKDSLTFVCTDFAIGHLKRLTFPAGNKRFTICPEFQLEQASPHHNLNCIELDWDDIHDSPLLVSDSVNCRHFTNQF